MGQGVWGSVMTQLEGPSLRVPTTSGISEADDTSLHRWRAPGSRAKLGAAWAPRGRRRTHQLELFLWRHHTAGIVAGIVGRRMEQEWAARGGSSVLQGACGTCGFQSRPSATRAAASGAAAALAPSAWPREQPPLEPQPAAQLSAPAGRPCCAAGWPLAAPAAPAPAEALRLPRLLPGPPLAAARLVALHTELHWTSRRSL